MHVGDTNSTLQRSMLDDDEHYAVNKIKVLLTYCLVDAAVVQDMTVQFDTDHRVVAVHTGKGNVDH